MEGSEEQPMRQRKPRGADVLENNEESLPRRRDLHQMLATGFKLRTGIDHRI